MKQEYNWQKFIKTSFESPKLVSMYNNFFTMFEKRWDEYLLPYSFSERGQLEKGNRLRPMLVYWGYLLNNHNDDFFRCNKSDMVHIIDFCVAIESIHKSSLLLDDLIDRDVARHGQNTFHVLHGNDTTIMVASHILLKGILELHDKLVFSQSSPHLTLKSLHLLLVTAYEMTKGALEEVSSNINRQITIDKIQRIISLETSSIIKNSLILGYNSVGDCNESIDSLLSEIGSSCGYIFQLFNDLEPYGNKQNLTFHKGRLSIDFQKNRKNIVIAYVHELASEEERSILNNTDTPDQLIVFIEKMIHKYGVVQIMLEEIKTLEEGILASVDEIQTITNNDTWCRQFRQFLKILLFFIKKRALK